MSHPVVTMLEEEKVERIYDILSKYSHDGFPVVDNYSPETVRYIFTVKFTLFQLSALVNGDSFYRLYFYRLTWLQNVLNNT